jgi:hypothetical protein
MPRPSWIPLLVALAAPAAAQRGDVLAYITARADYQRTMDSLWSKSSDAAMKVDGNFVTRFGPLLTGIAGTLQFPMPVDSTKTQIGSMQGFSENNALADGVIHTLKDGTKVFVTDTTVFRAWAQQTGKSGDIDGLLKSGSAIGQIFDTNAASYRCGFIPVNPRGRDLVTALMIEYAQDKLPGCTMDGVIVAVRLDHRLIVARRMLPAGTKPNASLATSIAQALLDRLPDR